MKTNFTSLAAAGIRLFLLCSMSASLGPWMSSSAATQEPLYYHYFKERRPLKLDTERVAVLRARTAPVDGLKQALPRFGVAPDGTRVLPVAGWSLANTPG